MINTSYPVFPLPSLLSQIGIEHPHVGKHAHNNNRSLHNRNYIGRPYYLFQLLFALCICVEFPAQPVQLFLV